MFVDTVSVRILVVVEVVRLTAVRAAGKVMLAGIGMGFGLLQWLVDALVDSSLLVCFCCLMRSSVYGVL